MTPERSSRTASGLDALVEGKLSTLRTLLAQLGEDADARLALSRRVEHALDVVECALDAEVDLVQDAPPSAARRAMLEERLLRVAGERRGEWVRCWQDLAGLRVEARRTWREYAELGARLALLTGYRRDEARR